MCPKLQLTKSPASPPPQRTDTEVETAHRLHETPATVSSAPDPHGDKLSQTVKRCLSLREEAAAASAQDAEEIEASEEVGELAGYLGELYLPRPGVSADAALMADLMYT